MKKGARVKILFNISRDFPANCRAVVTDSDDKSGAFTIERRVDGKKMALHCSLLDQASVVVLKGQ